MPVLANPVNSELSGEFTVDQVAEKHACPVGPEDRTGGWTGRPTAWPPALMDNGGNSRDDKFPKSIAVGNPAAAGLRK